MSSDLRAGLQIGICGSCLVLMPVLITAGILRGNWTAVAITSAATVSGIAGLVLAWRSRTRNGE